MSEAHALNSVNRHYLDKVMHLAEERDIKATEDIFDARGMKLVAKGATISRGLQERLMMRRLSKPFESSIGVDGSLGTEAIAAEARRIADSVEPVKSMLTLQQGGMSPVQVVSGIRLGTSMSTMLTVLQQAGPDALQHAVLVSLVAVYLAQRCGLGMNDQNTVALAGLLHDIGELYIDPEYLHSSRRLHPHEWRHVAVHPRIGQMLIEGLEAYPPAVARAVYEHHERLDGGGYPRQLAGPAISMAGQIVSVAETISGIFLSPSQPLKRAELALKIIPGEHAHQLVSAIATAMQQVGAPGAADAMDPSHGQDANRVRELYQRIDAVVECAQAMQDSAAVTSAQGRKLLSETVRRAGVVRRAFSSTGLDACLNQDVRIFESPSFEILFEATVAVREIEWRLRDIARDLALHTATLESHEGEALQPLVSLLDGEES